MPAEAFSDWLAIEFFSCGLFSTSDSDLKLGYCVCCKCLHVCMCLLIIVMWHVTVGTLDSESRNPSSYLGGTLRQFFCLECFDAVGWVAGRASGL